MNIECHMITECQAILRSGKRIGQKCKLKSKVTFEGEHYCGRHKMLIFEAQMVIIKKILNISKNNEKKMLNVIKIITEIDQIIEKV